MIKTLARVLACSAVVTSCAWAADGKMAAIDLVKEAVAFAKTNGRDKVLAEVNSPKGAFDKGELYVFVYDMDGVVLAHPKNKKIVGKNLLELPDADHKPFRKYIIVTAKEKGSGWVDYKYLNPDSNKVEEKTTYLMASNNMIFCCGVYK
jgi:cytochrome c